MKSIDYKNGNHYEGEVNDKDLPDGQGTYRYAKGSCYEGHFSEGLRDGYGKFTWNTGDYYEGDWVANNRTGNGRLVFRSGKVQEGRFENNVFISE